MVYHADTAPASGITAYRAYAPGIVYSKPAGTSWYMQLTVGNSTKRYSSVMKDHLCQIMQSTLLALHPYIC